jgi:hypothetical protein
MIYIYIFFLTTISLTHGGSSTAHIYTEYRERYITIKKLTNGKCGPCPIFVSYTLPFALKLRKKHGKTSVRVAAHKTQADTVQYKNNEQS